MNEYFFISYSLLMCLIFIFVPKYIAMKKNLILVCLAVWSLFAGSCQSKKQEKTLPNPVPTGNPVLDSWSKKIASLPADAALYAGRAQAFYEEKSYEFALKDLARAISLDSTNVPYHHLLANVYMDSNQSRLALKAMERAAALSRDSIPTLLKLAEFQLIVRQNTESLLTIKKILDKDHQNGDAFLLMGVNLKETGDTARAIKSFQKAVSYDADLIDAWVNLGNIFSIRNNAEALKYFDTAIRIDTASEEAWHGKAVWYQQHRDYPKALELYQKIGTINPYYADAFYNSGLIYAELDSLEQAKAQFDIVTQVAPTYITAYYQRGLLAERRKDFVAARKDFVRANAMSPNFEPAQKALARLPK